MNDIRTLGQTKVRRRLLKAWLKARDEAVNHPSSLNVPSIDYDDLCLWYETEDGPDCKSCPLKDCERPGSLWSRCYEKGVGHNEIINIIARWMTPLEAKQILAKKNAIEHYFVKADELLAIAQKEGEG